jgi:hypothetical protein
VSDRTIGELGNSIDNIEARGKWVFVPDNHGFYTFPIPATSEDPRDDATKILDAMAGPLRGAAAHVTDLIDEGEDG